MCSKRGRRSTEKGTNGVLPEDIEIEILRRLPVKSLMRFKYVCKTWYNLVKSLSFIKLYSSNCDNKRKVNLFYKSCAVNGNDETTIISFCVSDIGKDLKISAPVEFVNIVGCSHGLVCFSLTFKQDKYVVWNPATRTSRQITATSTFSTPSKIKHELSKDLRSGFFYDLTTDSYKLARIHSIPTRCHQRLHVGHVQVEIFTSRDDLWTTKTIEFPCPFYERGYIRWETSTKRYLYWTLTYSLSAERDYKYCILCFDMVEEIFMRVETPALVRDDCDGFYIKLFRHGEALAVCFLFAPEVWLMNDCDGIDPYHSWSKEPAFRLSYVDYPIGSFRKHDVDWVVLSLGDNEYLVCNPTTGETMDFFECYRSRRWQNQFFLYSESLASVECSSDS